MQGKGQNWQNESTGWQQAVIPRGEGQAQEVVAKSKLIENSQFLHQGPKLNPVAELLQLRGRQLGPAFRLLAHIEETSGGHLALLLLHT